MPRSLVLLVRLAALIAGSLGVYEFCVVPYRAAIIEGEVDRRSTTAEAAAPERGAILARTNLRDLERIAPARRLEPSWYMLVGGNCTLLERWPEAIDAYTQALRIDQRPEIYFNRGLALLQTGRTDAAVADMATAVRFNPYLLDHIDGELRTRVAAAAGVR